jgi:pyridoxamine 5'-phosphate oxidase
MDASTDPIAAFAEAFDRARAIETGDATAMTLATADAAGRPSARMVLLKGIDARGFAFYTNRTSRKGRQLAENAAAALCIYWPTLHEQVRVEGTVELVSDDESDAYFATRPRGSQIAAWASRQSAALASPDELAERVRELEQRFDGREVPRPEFWGGYRVVPERIEFWWGKKDRLHERALFVRAGGGWTFEALQP